jgi:hypothetical protein
MQLLSLQGSGMSDQKHGEPGGRENSYRQGASAKDLAQGPDVLQPGKAGDLGNGPATGKREAPDATQNSAAPDKLSDAGARTTSSPRHTPLPEDSQPAEGAEPSNTYSGT